MWLKTDLNICESEKIYIMPFPLVIQRLNTFEGEIYLHNIVLQ